VSQYVTCPGIELANAQKASAAAKADLATKRTAAAKAIGGGDGTAALLTQQCNGIVNQADNERDPLTGAALKGCRVRRLPHRGKTVQSDQANVDWSTKWKAQRANVSDGQLLFELNCARCHTRVVELRSDRSHRARPER